VRIFRWLFWTVALSALIWFGTTVRLGRRTLFGHLLAIARTPEAKDLADGTKEEAEKVAERVKRDLHADAGAPSEKLDEADRRALRKLVQEKAAK
jgi:hypothetical protein